MQLRHSAAGIWDRPSGSRAESLHRLLCVQSRSLWRRYCGCHQGHSWLDTGGHRRSTFVRGPCVKKERLTGASFSLFFFNRCEPPWSSLFGTELMGTPIFPNGTYIAPVTANAGNTYFNVTMQCYDGNRNITERKCAPDFFESLTNLYSPSFLSTQPHQVSRVSSTCVFFVVPRLT